MSGSEELASGLSDGAAKMPAYDTTLQARERRDDVGAGRPGHDQAGRGPQVRHRLRAVLHPARPVDRCAADLLHHQAAVRARAWPRAHPHRSRRLPGSCRRRRSASPRRSSCSLVVQFGLGLAPVQPLAFYGIGLLTRPGLRRDPAVPQRRVRRGRQAAVDRADDAAADLGGGDLPHPDGARVLPGASARACR